MLLMGSQLELFEVIIITILYTPHLLVYFANNYITTYLLIINTCCRHFCYSNIYYIGLGHQKVAAWISVGSNYVLALPMAYVLTFPAGWGMTGIWIGLFIALSLSATGQCIYVFIVNWDNEVEKISYRVKAEESQIQDTHQEERCNTPLLAPVT